MITIRQLGGDTTAKLFPAIGSEVIGLCICKATATVLKKTEVGYILDPLFRKRNIRIRERYNYHHCSNLQVKGQITVGYDTDADLHFVWQGSAMSIESKGIFYINIESSDGDYHWVEYDPDTGKPRVSHFLKWIRKEKPDHTGFYILASYSSSTWRSQFRTWYAFEWAYYFPYNDIADEAEFFFAFTPESFKDWEDETKEFLALSPEQIAGFHPTSVISGDWEEVSWQLLQLTEEELNAIYSAIILYDGYDGDLFDGWEPTLWYKAMENFRPKRISSLETFVGYAEMPAVVQNALQLMATATGAIPANWKCSVKALAGLYLIWCYVVRPAKEDMKIFSSWLETYTNLDRFDGKRLNSRKSLILNEWVGWSQATIQLTPYVTDVPPDLSEAFDEIERRGGSHTLTAADSFALVPRAVHMDVAVLNAVDILPFSPGGMARDAWNYVSLSFVWDWFTSADSVAENRELRDYLSLLPVRYACQTAKAWRTYDDALTKRIRRLCNQTVSVAVTGTKYQRWYFDKVPEKTLPLYSYQATSVSSIWLQGAALVAQRLL